jgi:hypothetical protein
MPEPSVTSGQSIARVILRRLLIALAFFLGLLGYDWQWNDPALSVLEHQLVGAWGHPQLCTPRDMGILVGPMTSPYHVIELSPDRVCRFWFASADDLTQRYIISEGRWGIDNGKLRIEDMPITSPHRVISEIEWHIEAISGGSLSLRRLYAPHRFREPRDEPFRLVGAVRLEIMAEQGKALTWNRLPDWKR